MALVLRLVARRMTHDNLWFDDYFCLVGYVSSIAALLDFSSFFFEKKKGKKKILRFSFDGGVLCRSLLLQTMAGLFNVRCVVFS